MNEPKAESTPAPVIEKTVVQMQSELAEEILSCLELEPRDLNHQQWDNIRGSIAHYTVTIVERMQRRES